MADHTYSLLPVTVVLEAPPDEVLASLLHSAFSAPAVPPSGAGLGPRMPAQWIARSEPGRPAVTYRLNGGAPRFLLLRFNAEMGAESGTVLRVECEYQLPDGCLPRSVAHWHTRDAVTLLRDRVLAAAVAAMPGAPRSAPHLARTAPRSAATAALQLILGGHVWQAELRDRSQTGLAVLLDVPAGSAAEVVRLLRERSMVEVSAPSPTGETRAVVVVRRARVCPDGVDVGLRLLNPAQAGSFLALAHRRQAVPVPTFAPLQVAAPPTAYIAGDKRRGHRIAVRAVARLFVDGAEWHGEVLDMSDVGLALVLIATPGSAEAGVAALLRQAGVVRLRRAGERAVAAVEVTRAIARRGGIEVGLQCLQPDALRAFLQPSPRSTHLPLREN